MEADALWAKIPPALKLCVDPAEMRWRPLIDLTGSTSHRSSIYTDIWDK